MCRCVSASDQSRRHRHDSIDTDQMSYMTAQSPDAPSLSSVMSPSSTVEEDFNFVLSLNDFAEMCQTPTRNVAEVRPQVRPSAAASALQHFTSPLTTKPSYLL